MKIIRHRHIDEFLTLSSSLTVQTFNLVTTDHISTYSRRTHEFKSERSVLGSSSEGRPSTVWWRNAGTADILIRSDHIVTRMELCKRCRNNQQLPRIALPQSFVLCRILSILQDYDSIRGLWIHDRHSRCPEHVLFVPIWLMSNLLWCSNGQGLLEG